MLLLQQPRSKFECKNSCKETTTQKMRVMRVAADKWWVKCTKDLTTILIFNGYISVCNPMSNKYLNNNVISKYTNYYEYDKCFWNNVVSQSLLAK